MLAWQEHGSPQQTWLENEGRFGGGVIQPRILEWLMRAAPLGGTRGTDSQNYYLSSLSMDSIYRELS